MENPLKRKPGGNNPGGWKRKEDETEEEFQTRLDARRKQAGANLQRGRDRKPKTSEPAVTKKALTTTVGLINGVVAMFSPMDALGKVQIADQTIDEQEMLVDALIETQNTSPLFRKYLGRFVGVAGQASLLGAVALIFYVRLDRRGLVPSLGAPQAQPVAPEPEPQAEPDGMSYWQREEWKRNHPEPIEVEAI